MRKINTIVLFILLVPGLELLIYAWAAWTATLDSNNFFAIEPQFIFDKCARNSGRVSAALKLGILIVLGYYGLNQVYNDALKKERFRILLTLFTVNHLCHFFYVFQNFKHHSMALNISENKHGFTTFICILLVPVVVWRINKFSKVLALCLILHLFNVSYFIMDTFYDKIKPGQPAYHNQFGIFITGLALLYIVYKQLKEALSPRSGSVSG